MLSSFNHRCRNSLNGIKMSLYLFKREVGGPMPGELGELERSYQQLEVLFDRLQMIYRPLSLDAGSFPAGPAFRRALAVLALVVQPRGRTLDSARPTGRSARRF